MTREASPLQSVAAQMIWLIARIKKDKCEWTSGTRVDLLSEEMSLFLFDRNPFPSRSSKWRVSIWWTWRVEKNVWVWETLKVPEGTNEGAAPLRSWRSLTPLLHMSPRHNIEIFSPLADDWHKFDVQRYKEVVEGAEGKYNIEMLFDHLNTEIPSDSTPPPNQNRKSKNIQRDLIHT